jgi:hypothetical protein
VGPKCEWCGRPIPVRAGPGRPRRFCRQSCKQRAHEARRRAAELGLSEHDLVVARAELDALYDRLYVLECAIEDVQRDLTASATKRDYQEAVDWLLEAARPVVERRLG